MRRAEEDLDAVREAYAELEARFAEDLQELRDEYAEKEYELANVTVRPRKTEILIEPLKVVWSPWRVDTDGNAHPAE